MEYIRASKISAFLMGIFVVIPVMAHEYLNIESFPQRIVLMIIWISYVVSDFYFVIGPLRRIRYGPLYLWLVPADDFNKLIGRGLSWFLGGLLAVALLETTNAI